MNTKKDKEFDYKTFMKEGTLDPSEINRGPGARQKRREVGKTRITIRIDEEIIKKFKKIAPGGRGYQSLINIALREWLAAQGVKELVSNKISEVVDQAVVSIQNVAQSSK